MTDIVTELIQWRKDNKYTQAQPALILRLNVERCSAAAPILNVSDGDNRAYGAIDGIPDYVWDNTVSM